MTRAAIEKDLKDFKVEWATKLKEVGGRWQNKVCQPELIDNEMEIGGCPGH